MELGLSLDLYQPFRDFEGVGPDLLEQNLRRAAAKFALMNRLGIETMLLCSNVATARSGDEQLAAAQLRQLGDLAEPFGVRVAYEALAWGRFVDSYEVAARIVRLADHDRIGVCLDSFHILSKGHSPEAIETIAADKIFFVQLADAPLLSMDVLSWSRHHRLFPGEGGFDLGAFMGHLVRTGYDGPISLEIFNDTFRQSDTRSTAVGARRSLRWLENEAACWLGASAGGRAARMSVAAAAGRRARPPASTTSSCARRRWTTCGRCWHSSASARTVRTGRRASSSGRRAPRASCSVVPSRTDRSRPWRGSASRCATRIAALRRATDLFAPQVHREESAGDEPLVGVRAPDGSEVFFGAEGETEPAWVREFGAPSGEGSEPASRGSTTSTSRSPGSTSTPACCSSTPCSTCTPQPSMEVAAPVGLVRSQVLRSADGIVRIALNLVPPAADKDAILPQHIAFAASDVLALARAARDRGFRPSTSRPTTTTTSRRGIDIDPALLDELKDLNVMYDRDEAGEFLHFYTPRSGRSSSRSSSAAAATTATARSTRPFASPPSTSSAMRRRQERRRDPPCRRIPVRAHLL